MPDLAAGTVTSSVLAVATLIATYMTGRGKGRAEAREIEAKSDVMVSAESRAIAGDLRAELAIERTERRRLEQKLEEERRQYDERLEAARRREAELEQRLAVAEHDLEEARRREARLEQRLAAAEKELAQLAQMVRKLGGNLPGETPPKGSPKAGPG